MYLNSPIKNTFAKHVMMGIICFLSNKKMKDNRLARFYKSTEDIRRK